MNLENLQRLPDGRIFHTMVSVREFIIICGGRGFGSSRGYNDLWSYNTISGVWKRYELPIEVKNTFYPMTCAVGNLVYIFGAEVFENDFYHINSLFSFDVTHGTWKTLYYHADGHENRIVRIQFSFICYNDGFLYIMGTGEEDSESNLIYKFCLETLAWTLVQQLGETPIFDDLFNGTVYKNKLYVFACSQGATTRFREVYIFDLSTNKWTKRSTSAKDQQYPPDRMLGIYAFSSKCAYMCGRTIPGRTAILLDIWRIELETLEWVKLDKSLPRVIYGHRMSVVEDTFLYHVGMDKKNSRYVDVVERLYLQFPPLFRICLESVCRSPNNTDYINSLPQYIVDHLNL